LKKTIKIIAVLLGVVIALMVALAVALPLLIDPNKYKDDIVRAVKDNTGRELKIEGQLGLSVFPWIGLEAGAMELGNAPGFGPTPFAKIQSAGIKVRLVPLLSKKIVVDTVKLDGLALNLARNRQGRSNWDDLVGEPKEGKKPKAEPKAAEKIALPAFGIGGIDIRRANITWSDQTSGAQYAVKNLDLKTGTILRSQPVELKLAFDLESGDPPLRTRVDLKSRVAVDIDRQTLDIPNLTLNLAGMQLNAGVKGQKIFDSPVLSGQAEIAPFNLRELMTTLGAKPDTADGKAFSKFGLKTTFNVSGNHVQLKGLGATLDDTRLRGLFEMRGSSYKFGLELDQIDVDRYLPPPVAATAVSGGKAAPPAKPVEIPLQALRDLWIDGIVSVKKMKAFNLHSTDIQLKIAAKNGLINLGPNQAKLYAGTYSGRTVLDARGKTPAFTFDEQLSGIQIGPFLKDAGVFDKYSGSGQLGIKLSARGLTAGDITRTLNGTVNVLLRDGKIEGVNLQKLINDARMVYEKARGKPVRASTQPSDETAFRRLSATVRVTNGMARNDDLKLEGPVLQAGGQGTADLVRERLDYRLQVTLTEDASRKGTTVPVHGKDPRRRTLGAILRDLDLSKEDL